MGDAASKADCACCGPQDPALEQQAQYTAPNVASAYSVPQGGGPAPAPRTLQRAPAASVPGGGEQDFLPEGGGWADEEEHASPLFVPPPPPMTEAELRAEKEKAERAARRESEEEAAQKARQATAAAQQRQQPPPRSERAPHPAPPPAPRPAAAAPAADAPPSRSPPAAAAAAAGAAPAASGGGFGGGMDLEVVLIDLEGAETQAYISALTEISGGMGSVGPDNAQLRDFLLTNTALSADDLDTELLKVATASESFSVEMDGFISLIRENCISENDALQQFISLSSDGMEITAEDCRSGLLNLLQHRLNMSWPEATAERVFDVVMVDAALTISMEQWITYCKKIGRIARLARYLRL